MRKICFLLWLCLLAFSFNGQAQMTASAFEGSVADPAGAAIPGATVVLTHVPTGTRSGTQADGGGKFLLNNLRPGGPYSVQVSFVGYTTQTQDGLYLNLGKVARQTFTLARPPPRPWAR